MRASALRPLAETPGALGSVLLHAGLASLLLLLARLQPPIVPPDDSVAVEILTEGEFRAATAPAPPAPTTQADRGTATEAPTPQEPVVRPSVMLSGRTLADPRSRQARAALAQMTGEERMVQLCDVEAMAQIAAFDPGRRPDRVFDQATAETRIAGNEVVAAGAAFRSEHAWYGLRFRCRLTGDGADVASFEFSIGAAIPREDWEELGLPPVH